MIYAIDGVERATPIPTDHPFSELLEHVRANCTPETALISSIRVDGQEVDSETEAAIGPLPVSQLGKIEIFTARPREIAEETLQMLSQFAEHLSTLSASSSGLVDDPGLFAPKFAAIIDGIETFTTGLTGVKRILRIGSMAPITTFESDLLSILQDILRCREVGETTYLVDLLAKRLPANLTSWRADGIPAIIRSRDC